MPNYIALLRGINVSGKNRIKMVDLKQLFINLNYSNVITYIQSGNVVFTSEEIDASKIKEIIINAIEKEFNYSISAIILTKSELNNIFNLNPFIEQNKNIDIKKLHVTLLNEIPIQENIEQLKKVIITNNDEFQLANTTIYLHCPNGYGKTKLNTNLVENKLKSVATTRNWNTITKLIELSNQ